MYIFIAGLVGLLVTMMGWLNSQLALNVGQLMSLLIFHFFAFSFIGLITVFAQPKSNTGRIPFHLYAGGMVGVLVVYLNNLCFIKLGVSVTLSMIIMGQSIGSVLTDSTGFLNMEKHHFRKKKLIGFSLMMVGILSIVEQWQLDYIYIFLALLTGILVLLSIILTAQLGLRAGVFKATRINYLTGLITVLFIIALKGFNVPGSLNTISGIHPAFLVGGGICGVLIVIGFNTVVPRIPAIYTTITMFLGQILTGLIIDLNMGRMISAGLIIGCLLVFGGLMINIFIDKFEPLQNQKMQCHGSNSGLVKI